MPLRSFVRGTLVPGRILMLAIVVLLAKITVISVFIPELMTENEAAAASTMMTWMYSLFAVAAMALGLAVIALIKGRRSWPAWLSLPVSLLAALMTPFAYVTW